MDELVKVEAHDAEVLCLEYSKPETGEPTWGLQGTGHLAEPETSRWCLVGLRTTAGRLVFSKGPVTRPLDQGDRDSRKQDTCRQGSA